MCTVLFSEIAGSINPDYLLYTSYPGFFLKEFSLKNSETGMTSIQTPIIIYKDIIFPEILANVR